MMRFLIVTIFVMGFAKAPTFNSYYFATGGNDAGPGTSGAPFSNSGTKINSILAAASTADHLYFNRGDSFYVEITSVAAHGVTFDAYGAGVQPVMYGLTKLTSWTETSTGSHLWEAACNSGNNLDLVTVGGVTVPAGRTPNAGSYYNIDSHTNLSGTFPTWTATLTSTSIPAGTQNYVGGEAVIGINEYNIDRYKISVHSSNTITYNEFANVKDISSNGNKFFIQKHPATLDVQNEWYYYQAAHVLRMYSTSNPSTLNVKAATLNYFWNVSSRNNVVMQNLKIVGYDSIGITGQYLNNMWVLTSTIEDIGTTGIYTDHDSLIHIQNNYIHRMGNTGVDNRYTTKNTVTDNIIDSCGLIRGMNLQNNQQACGILSQTYDFFGDGTIRGNNSMIKKNTVSNTGYSGICWNGPGTHVDSNYVYNFGRTMTDGGGIYTNAIRDNATYRTVRNNIVKNGKGDRSMVSGGGTGGMPGIYLDDDAGQVMVINNTVDSVSRASVFLHNTLDVLVINNNLNARAGELCFATADDALGGTVRLTYVDGNNMYGLPGVPLIQLSSTANDYGSQGQFVNNTYARSSTTTPFQTFGPSSGNYSFSSWRSTFGYDNGSNFLTVNDDSVRMEYAVTPKYVYFANTYSDYSGSYGYFQYVLMPAYRSVMLFRRTFAFARLPKPIKFVP